MIKVDDKKACCGCSACAQKCPQKCIEMKCDLEGFEYPSVDEKKCIECGLCEKICPILNKQETNIEYDKENGLKTYVGYTKNDVREKSSSGGLFSLIAEEIIKRGGTIFGAAFDDSFLVHHIGISMTDDLFMIRGSKYIQSRIENTYVQAEKILQNGDLVLFSGTMCQIEGLKKYLSKDYDNLLTLDILCHGVPSPKVWEKYLHELEEKYNSKIEKILCRKKTYGWKCWSQYIKFNNGKEYEKMHFSDIFDKLFLKNICLRPSCHQCMFKELTRVSDITLGDAWGIGKIIPEMDDDRGTSIIINHTDKGDKLIQSILDKVEIRKIDDINLILKKDNDARRSVPEHKKRDKFFVLFNKGKTTTKLVKFVNFPMYKRVLYKIFK